jgi:hypothetical protein
MKISDCCGAEITDKKICSLCEEECKLVDYDSDDDSIYNNFCHEGGIKYER